MRKNLRFFVQRKATFQELLVQAPFLLGAGYAGRTQDKVREHIEELAQLGVPRPDAIPILFPITADQITTAHHIDVQGTMTSGEVEYVLLQLAGEWFVTVGSDHTDRELERFSVEKSKQMCPNVMAQTLWAAQDVRDHWDELVLRAWVTKEGTRTLYQEDSLAALLPPAELLTAVRSRVTHSLEEVPIFSGTIATLAGLIFADSFEMELSDPILKRAIRHRYTVRSLLATQGEASTEVVW